MLKIRSLKMAVVRMLFPPSLSESLTFDHPLIKSLPARLMVRFPSGALTAIENAAALKYLGSIESKMFSLAASLILGQAVAMKILYMDIIMQASGYASWGPLAHVALFILIAAVWLAAILFTVKWVGWRELPATSLLQERLDDDETLGHELLSSTSRRSSSARSLWMAECIYLLAHPQGRYRLCAAALESCNHPVPHPGPARSRL